MRPKLGILAGGGDIPARLAEVCRMQGRPYFVVAFEGHAEPEKIAPLPHVWIRLGQPAQGIARLRAEGVEELVMAGPVRRPSLAELRPDRQSVGLLGRVGAAAFQAGDDGLLSAVIGVLEDEGFRVVGIDEVMADLLAPEGVLGRHAPDETGLQDARKAARVARALGGLDIGQGAVVQNGLVLGVEAIEGTDALLARCARLRRAGPGGVLAKVSKPGQERRADLPTIGATTVAAAARAGLRGIAVEAGGTLIVDREAVTAEADALGLFLLGMDAREI